MNSLYEKFLFEQPHVFFDMDNEEDAVWDFCAEDKPKSWVVQLVNLYALRKLTSLNKNKNEEEVMYLSDNEMENITVRLLHDPFFLTQAKKCISDLIRDGKRKTIQLLSKYLPAKLSDSLGLSKKETFDEL